MSTLSFLFTMLFFISSNINNIKWIIEIISDNVSAKWNRQRTMEFIKRLNYLSMSKIWRTFIINVKRAAFTSYWDISFFFFFTVVVIVVVFSWKFRRLFISEKHWQLSCSKKTAFQVFDLFPIQGKLKRTGKCINDYFKKGNWF